MKRAPKLEPARQAAPHFSANTPELLPFLNPEARPGCRLGLSAGLTPRALPTRPKLHGPATSVGPALAFPSCRPRWGLHSTPSPTPPPAGGPRYLPPPQGGHEAGVPSERPSGPGRRPGRADTIHLHPPPPAPIGDRAPPAAPLHPPAERCGPTPGGKPPNSPPGPRRLQSSTRLRAPKRACLLLRAPYIVPEPVT